MQFFAHEHGNKRNREHQKRAAVKPNADGKPQTGAKPKPRRGRNALYAVIARNHNGARADKADAAHHLRRDARGVAASGDVGNVLARHHRHGGAEAYEHVSAKPGTAHFPCALKAEHAACRGGKQEPCRNGIDVAKKEAPAVHEYYNSSRGDCMLIEAL